MPVVETLSIISASVTIAKHVYSSSLGIHDWINNVKHIDKTIQDLADEVIAFREALQTVDRTLSAEVVREAACLDQDEDAVQLWSSLCDTLTECRATNTQIQTTLKPLQTSERGALLRKFTLDSLKAEIQMLKDQLAVHNRRLSLAVQMIQLRVSCATPNLITSNITGQISALRALMNSQIDMIAELSKNPSTSHAVTSEVIQQYFVSYNQTAQSLMSSADSIYKRSTWGGSVADLPEIRALEHWLEDVPSEVELESNHTPVWSTTHHPETVTTELTSFDGDAKVLQEPPWRAVPLSSDPEIALRQQRTERFLQSNNIANVHSLDFNGVDALTKIIDWHLKRKLIPRAEMMDALNYLYEIAPTGTIGSKTLGKLRCLQNIPLLHAFAYLGWSQNVDFLLKAGADPNDSVMIACDSLGHPKAYPTFGTITATAPLCAAMGGHANILRRLIDAGTSPRLHARTISPNAQSILHHAILWGQAAVVEVLLDAGVDIDQLLYCDLPSMSYHNDVQTALHCACTVKRPDIMKILIQRGADVNAKRGGNVTPLRLAASSAVMGPQAGTWRDCVDMMLDAGAVPNDKLTKTFLKELGKVWNEPATPKATRFSLLNRISLPGKKATASSVTSDDIKTGTFVKTSSVAESTS